MNPYHHELWDYNIGVAEELVKLGFGEIQFDYIRFPEPYPSLPKQVFPDSKDVSQARRARRSILKEAKTRLNKLGVRSTADIFGLVTTVGGAARGRTEVGEGLAARRRRAADGLSVALPARELGAPVSERRAVQDAFTRRSHAARERDKKLGITEPEHVRPWLQAFTLGKPAYGAGAARGAEEGASTIPATTAG